MDEEPVRAALTPAEQRAQQQRERDEELAARLLRRGDVEAIADALTKARQRPKRTPKAVENDEYAQMVERQVRSLIKRVGDNRDIELLPNVVRLRDVLDEAIVDIIELLLTPSGPLQHKFSWSDVGRVLGVRRQSAMEKYKRREPGQPKRGRPDRARKAVQPTPIRRSDTA